MLHGRCEPYHLPLLVSARWGNQRGINLFRNLSHFPSGVAGDGGANGGGAAGAVYSGDGGDRGAGGRSYPDLVCLGGPPLNLTQVESIIQEKCYAQAGSRDSRVEHAARLIHSAREAINFNSIYVRNCTEAVPTNFLKEMLRWVPTVPTYLPK